MLVGHGRRSRPTIVVPGGKRRELRDSTALEPAR
jgi:hypothetical protein